MTAYWVYFLLPVVGVLSPLTLVGRARIISWSLFLLIGVLFLGLRSEIGGDWDNYLDFTERVATERFSFIYRSQNSGYVFLNWISAKIGWGVYGVNLACAGLFLGGLAFFCNKQPHPTLSWLVATPYLVIVVGMGYTRQSVAVGLAMSAFTFLENRRGWWFLVLILLASTFHKSAILLLPLGLALINREISSRFINSLRQGLVSNMVLSLVILGILLSGVIAVRNSQLFASEFRAYILLDSWNSEGGIIRAVMTAIPAAFLLIYHRKWSLYFGSSRIWYWIAFLAIITLIITPLVSTFADRIGVYLIALQIYVVSRLPILMKNDVLKGLVTIGISGLYALVLFVWLNYAAHAYYWVPYKTMTLT